MCNFISESAGGGGECQTRQYVLSGLEAAASFNRITSTHLMTTPGLLHKGNGFLFDIRVGPNDYFHYQINY